jgi:hypothetical protein
MGVEAKKAMKIKPIVFPAYSPDLNPLDYFLWSEVERRMASQTVRKNESLEAYKSRLKRTAMSIPSSLIKQAVGKMKPKAAEIVAAAGGRIQSD